MGKSSKEIVPDIVVKDDGTLCKKKSLITKCFTAHCYAFHAALSHPVVSVNFILEKIILFAMKTSLLEQYMKS
eukprot:snap_masked-scaffold_8-processed-gene-0.15-mRNA-1 protein AED:1.00 eAED:1.00 QI:0/-1/0/0/-1/1/1/0/72